MVWKHILRTAVALCLAASAANAQLLTTGAGCSTVSCQPAAASSAYSGPGNVVSGAIAWWGLRAYNAAWATGNGQLVNLSRASDSHTCDILAASTGGMGNTANCSTGGDNGQSASSFCNATTCSGTMMYDQSGTIGCNNPAAQACNAGQVTAADQPTLTFSCGGTGKPCLTFNGTSDFLASNAITSNTSQPITNIAEAERTGNTSAFQMPDGGSGNRSSIFFTSSANSCILFAGSVTTSFTCNDNATHSMIGVMNGASSVGVIDGTATTGLSSGTTGVVSGDNYVIGNNSFSQFLTGNWFEGGDWPSGFNSTQYGNMATNMDSYY